MMMMMMKNSIILVPCVLLALCLIVQASQNSWGPDECCFKFVSKQLPKNKVVSYRYTHSQCSEDAVLLTLKNGNELCARPSAKWVKNIIEAME